MKSFTKQCLTHQCKEQTNRPITHSPSVPLTFNCPIPHSLPFFSLSHTTNEHIGNQCFLTHQLHPCIKDLCKKESSLTKLQHESKLCLSLSLHWGFVWFALRSALYMTIRVLWLSFKVLHWITHTFSLIKSCYGETQTFVWFIMEFCSEFQSFWKHNSVLSQFHTNKP